MNYAPRTLLLVLPVLLALPVGAHAQSGADALIEQGVSLREQGRDAEALRLFEDAHRQEPSARALAQIGLAEQALRRYVPACEHLSEALASRDPWVEERHSVLEGALNAARQQVGQLSVQGEPRGAEVMINGQVRGRLPLPAIYMQPASMLIEVRAEGYAASRDQVSVGRGQQVDHRVSLTPEAAPTQTPATSPTATPTTSPAQSSTTRPETPPSRPPASSGGSLNPAGPVLLGIGGAMLATGLVTGLLTLDADSRLAAVCDGNRCMPSGEAILDERRSLAIATDVMLFGGAALATVGLILTLVLD